MSNLVCPNAKRNEMEEAFQLDGTRLTGTYARKVWGSGTGWRDDMQLELSGAPPAGAGRLACGRCFTADMSTS